MLTARDLPRGARRSTARASVVAALTASWLCAAAIAAPGVAMAQGESVASASDADKARAQELYKSGAMSYEFRRWDDALRKFRDSYAVVRSPNTHLMIARVLSELGHKAEAYNELVATEAEARVEGERYAETGVKASELRATLARDVALLLVEVEVTGGEPAAATVLVGGEDHPRTRWGAPFATRPGPIEVIGRFHGAERARQKVTLTKGTTQTVKLAIGAATAPEEPAPPPPAPIVTAPPDAERDDGGSLVPLIAVSAGVGAGGLAVFTVFGLMNQSTYDSLEQRCSSGCDRATIADEVDEGKTQQTVANIGLVVGGIGVAAAATFLVLELSDDDAESASSTRLRVGPTGVSATGAF